MKPQSTLMIMACTDKSGQRVWAVQSTSQTKANGFPTFHLVTWNASTSAWDCPCQSRKPCIHMRFASEASRIEQQRVDAAFDALTAIHFGLDSAEELVTQYFDDYDDSNPRRDELEVAMKAEPLTVLPERPSHQIAINNTIVRVYDDEPIIAAQPSQAAHLYRTTTGRTQEAW